MTTSAVRAARDYNRGLVAPIRWVHVALAGAAPVVARPWRWAADPGRRTWAQPLLLAVVSFVVLFPFDGPISRGAIWAGTRVGGDLRRQLLWLQEYGQFGAVVIVALVIWLLDAARRRRLLDWLAGIAAAALIVLPMKVLVGRPRPKFADPETILGPFGAYPLGPGRGVRHAWELGSGISSDLWSMPSSHTAYAVVMSVFLAAVYPRLRWLVAILAVVVALCRVLFGAHWASDVAVGAAVGLLGGRLAAQGAGEWVADRLTRRAQA